MKDTSSVSILLVDDVPTNLMMLARILRSEEYTVETAASGAEALELMGLGDFALVLLDIQMPDMDGYEVANRMRADEKLKDIPIIFITAINRSEENIFEGYSAGAVDYLFKPVNAFLLRCKVAIFCEMHRQRVQLRERYEEIRRKNEELTRQMQEIKTLRGLLPICAHCRKVRNDKGYWETIEHYVQTHSEAQFSHCLCTDCIQKLYPDIPMEQFLGSELLTGDSCASPCCDQTRNK